MTITFTGLSFLLASLTIGLLSFRFFQYWKSDRNSVSLCWFWFTALAFFFLLITSVGGLFFADSPTALKRVVIITNFLEVLASAIVGYVIVLLKFPKQSPKLGFFVVLLLGLPAIVAGIILPSHPYVDVFLAINWDIPPLAGGLLFLLFLITWLPAGFILLEQYRSAKEQRLRDRAVGLGTLIIFGFIVGLLDWLLEKVMGLGTVSSDIGMVLVSFIALIIIFLTQKAPESKEKKVRPEKSEPQIQW